MRFFCCSFFCNSNEGKKNRKNIAVSSDKLRYQVRWEGKFCTRLVNNERTFVWVSVSLIELLNRWEFCSFPFVCKSTTQQKVSFLSMAHKTRAKATEQRVANQLSIQTRIFSLFTTKWNQSIEMKGFLLKFHSKKKKNCFAKRENPIFGILEIFFSNFKLEKAK